MGAGDAGSFGKRQSETASVGVFDRASIVLQSSQRSPSWESHARMARNRAMTTVSIPKAQAALPDMEELLAALEELEPVEADKVSRYLLHLQARRKAPHLSEREA